MQKNCLGRMRYRICYAKYNCQSNIRVITLSYCFFLVLLFFINFDLLCAIKITGPINKLGILTIQLIIKIAYVLNE